MPRHRLAPPVLAAALALGPGCTPHTVPAGHVGVLTVWGAVQEEVHPEGLYWETIGRTFIDFDARVQKKEVTATASSKDLQVVSTVIALNYRIDRTKARDIFQNIGALEVVEATIIDPVLQEAVKTATARYNAEELITNRREVKEAIATYVRERLLASHLEVTDLAIVNFQFDNKFQEAIERKQVAEQQALTASNDLKRIEVEARQAEAKAQGVANSSLIEARAEAERQELLRKTITSELVQWEAIQKWDGKLPVVQGSGSAAIVDVGSIAATARN
jgi:regulator of protease activity HflC (stomatin/prohibitin superfamily)